jgi:hypothetical protein
VTLERLAETDAWTWERLQILIRAGWHVGITPAFGGGSLILVERDDRRFGREVRDGVLTTCAFSGAQMSWESERPGTFDDAVADLMAEASRASHELALMLERHDFAEQLSIFAA